MEKFNALEALMIILLIGFVFGIAITIGAVSHPFLGVMFVVFIIIAFIIKYTK